MTDIQQLRDDLSFLRRAINRRGQRDPAKSLTYLVWAAYVLIGFTLIDINPLYANAFFLIGFIPATLLSKHLGKRAAALAGDDDRDKSNRAILHFNGGIALAMAASAALQFTVPALRGIHGGQLCVILVGLDYFLAGVHFDAYFLWLGPVLIIGGILVGYVPHYPWTLLGLVIALGLSVPYLYARFTHGQAR